MEKSSKKSRKRSLKQQTFEESLKELDNLCIPECSHRSPPVISVIDVQRDCETGAISRKPGKIYPKKKKEKQSKSKEGNSSFVRSSFESLGVPEIETTTEQADSLFGCDIEPQNRDAFLQQLKSLEAELPSSGVQETEWANRKRNLADNWASSRDLLFYYLLMRNSIPETHISCSKCHLNVAVLRCVECRQLLCSECDDLAHIEHPFHDREMWKNGFFQGIGNRMTIIEDEVCAIERPLPINFPSCCPNCKELNSIECKCVESKITIISSKGRFEFNDVFFNCHHCSFIMSGCNHLSMIMCGYWPATPQKTTTFFTMDVLKLWDSLNNNSPGTSLSSFIRSLESISKKAGRPSSINQTSFGKSFQEWKYANGNVLHQSGGDNFCCPVCANVCHSIHIDGHRKTYRFKKVPRGIDDPLCGDQFIANDLEVQTHMKKLYDKMGSQDYQEDKMCGSSYWQAARSQSNHNFATLDETGLVVAGCRHVLALKAVNMFAGEQYGYALFLHRFLANAVQMRFIWQDIMCKYWPWLNRVVQNFPEMTELLSTSKALSVMHAKAHSLDCQLVWGGFYQDQAALSTGESMEQFFSYFAKCGLTTKSMTAAARIDALTQHAAFWNERKIENLASSLAKQYMKTKKKIVETLREQMVLTESMTVTPNDAMIESWETEFRRKAIASFECKSTNTVVNQLAELYKLHQEVISAPALDGYIEKNDEASSIISGQEEVHALFAKKQDDLARKKKRMQDLERKLVMGGYNKDDALRDGKNYLINSTLELLRTRIVHTYLNIQQQKLEISRLADTSKKRTKIRRAISKNSKIIEKTIGKYNTVAGLSTLPVTHIDKKDVSCGKFAWQAGTEEQTAPEWLRKQVVDKHVMLKRCKEELALLIEEMEAYCSHHKKKIDYLEAEKKDIGKCIDDIENGASETAAFNTLEALFPRYKSEESIKNLLEQEKAALVLRGMQCLRGMGVSACEERLKEAVSCFRKAVGNDCQTITAHQGTSTSDIEEDCLSNDEMEEMTDDEVEQVDPQEDESVADSILNSMN